MPYNQYYHKSCTTIHKYSTEKQLTNDYIKYKKMTPIDKNISNCSIANDCFKDLCGIIDCNKQNRPNQIYGEQNAQENGHLMPPSSTSMYHAPCAVNWFGTVILQKYSNLKIRVPLNSWRHVLNFVRKRATPRCLAPEHRIRLTRRYTVV